MKVLVFSGQVVDGTTGDEESINGETRRQIRERLNRMRDGDALVVNACEEERMS